MGNSKLWNLINPKDYVTAARYMLFLFAVAGKSADAVVASLGASSVPVPAVVVADHSRLFARSRWLFYQKISSVVRGVLLLCVKTLPKYTELPLGLLVVGVCETLFLYNSSLNYLDSSPFQRLSMYNPQKDCIPNPGARSLH
jgi:hypothetical protein